MARRMVGRNGKVECSEKASIGMAPQMTRPHKKRTTAGSICIDPHPTSALLDCAAAPGIRMCEKWGADHFESSPQNNHGMFRECSIGNAFWMTNAVAKLTTQIPRNDAKTLWFAGRSVLNPEKKPVARKSFPKVISSKVFWKFTTRDNPGA